jgi:hypothetical protein
MSPIVKTAINASIAALTPVAADPPSGDIGLGHDLSCVLDCNETFSETEGLHLLAEGLLRRLITRRGSVVDAPDYGYDLTSVLNKNMKLSDRQAIHSNVIGEVSKDERVDSVIAEIIFFAQSMTVRLSGVSAAGPFQFAFAVSSSSVLIEKVGSGSNAAADIPT